MSQRLGRSLAAVLLALSLSGCGGTFTLAPQELYQLPALPAKYTELNGELNAILAGGAEYAAPTSGANIQPVQMMDLDGDGREEALAFFRSPNDEKPLKICIFTSRDDVYQQTAAIESSGAGIYSVAYHDLDGDGRTELAVGWRVNADLLALTVYALRSDGPEELLRTDYVKYTVADLDQDGRPELTVFRSNEDGDGVAVCYGWQGGGLTARSTVRISSTMAELSQQGRVTAGALEGGGPALFVTGVSESAVTDVLTVRDGELSNLAVSSVTGVSSEIAPFCALYPTDIDGDGATEVPRPVELPETDGVASVHRRIDWWRYGTGGDAALALSTYHAQEDGWYLRLPDSWRDALQASRSVGLDEATVTLFLREGQSPPEPLLRITAITGTNRENRAVRGNRFTLSRQPETFYVAELLEAGAALGVTEDQVRQSFSLIAVEWSAGDN